jgi:hypothetical protein
MTIFIALVGRGVSVLVVGFLTCLTGIFSASAAVLLVNGSGILTGANGVVVNNQTYNVSFQLGTCASLFSGCNEPSDFLFPTVASALDASSALMSQVFIDGPAGEFDSRPELTPSCPRALFGNTGCSVFTPYAGFPSFIFQMGVAHNEPQEKLDEVFGSAFEFNADQSTQKQGLFAVWSISTSSAVAEPRGLAILVICLIGLIFVRRRSLH